MYTKESIDARTFPQIWETLSAAEQSNLRYELTRTGEASRTSVYNWSKGICPVSVGMRKKVASTISRTLGLNVSHITLFPLN